MRIYSINLPDDVFEAGEVKPTKPIKKKVPATNGAAKKRGASEVRANGLTSGCGVRYRSSWIVEEQSIPLTIANTFPDEPTDKHLSRTTRPQRQRNANKHQLLRLAEHGRELR